VIDTPGGPIRVTIVDVRGDKVRVGVDAPKAYPVHRNEVREAILRDEGVVKPGGCLSRRYSDMGDAP